MKVKVFVSQRFVHVYCGGKVKVLPSGSLWLSPQPQRRLVRNVLLKTFSEIFDISTDKRIAWPPLEGFVQSPLGRQSGFLKTYQTFYNCVCSFLKTTVKTTLWHRMTTLKHVDQ